MVPPCARAIARKVHATIRVRLKFSRSTARGRLSSCGFQLTGFIQDYIFQGGISERGQLDIVSARVARPPHPSVWPSAMKFLFCGGQDCPEWLGAEIATIAKVSSVRIRLLAKKIVQLYVEGKGAGPEVAKAAEKVRSGGQDMSNGDVGAIFAVLHHVITSAAKFDVEGTTLSLELQQLGLPRELSDALVRPYSEARAELRDAEWRNTLRFPPLTVEKRGDQTDLSPEVASRDAQGKEFVVLDLGHGRQGGADREKAVVSYAKLELLVHELRKAQSSLQDIV